MIKFFRKIRQKLLSENKLRKYLIYAAGEIVLVVIGILIALSLNNWNQKRVEKNTAYSYLKQIGEELETDIQFFEKLSYFLEQDIKQIEECISTQYKDDNALQECGRIISHNTDPIETGRTYQSMVNSGSIGLIEQEEVIKELDNYYLLDARFYNDYATFHKDFVINNIEGVLIHKLELLENGKYSVESLRRELESGNLSSIIHWQRKTVKKQLENAEDCHKSALALQELIKNVE